MEFGNVRNSKFTQGDRQLTYLHTITLKSPSDYGGRSVCFPDL